MYDNLYKRVNPTKVNADQQVSVAQAAGLLASSHTFPEFSSHLLGVTPTAPYLEYLDHAAPVLLEPVRGPDGTVLISERPRSGIDWDEAAVQRLPDGD